MRSALKTNMYIFGPFDCERQIKELFKLTNKSPGGGLGIFTDRDQRSIFLGFEFRKSVLFGVLLTAAAFLGLLDKCCIFKCFRFLKVLFWFKFYAPSTSLISVLHYYHIVLNFCQTNSVFGGYF